jgi:hypothetical protein
MDPKTLEMLTKLIPAGMPPEQAAKILEEFAKDASMNRHLGKLGNATRAVPWLMVMQEAASSTPSQDGEAELIERLMNPGVGPHKAPVGPVADQMGPLPAEKAPAPAAPAPALGAQAQGALDKFKAEQPLGKEALGALEKIKVMTRQDAAAAKQQAETEALDQLNYETNKAFEKHDPRSKADASAHERKQKMKKSIRSIQDLRELQK